MVTLFLPMEGAAPGEAGSLLYVVPIGQAWRRYGTNRARLVSPMGRSDLVMVIPRWEWRIFGADLGAAEAALAASTPGPVEESDELYLLSAAGANVKVRYDLMDIKLLREVDGDGLERWEPVMKAGFPLPAAEVVRVFDALGVPAPPRSRDAYTLDQLLAELVEPTHAVRVVRVHKRRRRYALASCMAEAADLEVDGRAARTVAVESEDPSAVVAAVRGLGLDTEVNTSYPRGLWARMDDGPQRYAVIDVGTNSVKFHIGERDPSGGWRTVADRAELTRLGEGLGDQGVIAAEPLERTVAAIAAMVEEATSQQVRAIAAVGTAGLRIARNREEVVAAIQARTGLTVEVISGEEEGRLAYLAVRAGLGVPEGSLVVFDTGGGSSQFTFGQGRRVEERFSVNVGAVRYTERYGLAGAVGPEVVDDALAAIAADLSRLDGRPHPDGLVGMGGAVTNMTAVKLELASYDPDRVQGAVLDRAELDRQIDLYRSRDADRRRQIVGLQPKRAEVILAGACIVRTVMDKLGQRSLTVSDRGLRHGLLLQRFGT
jgi:exopolyphosphatase/guanosine-5'-triphosphate,3'-diphosphate pyrophosphatase